MDLQRLQDYLWPFMSSRKTFHSLHLAPEVADILLCLGHPLTPGLSSCAQTKQGSDWPPFDNDPIDILRPGVGTA